MAQKPETKFRQNAVIPFLKTLKNTFFEPVQQVAINGSPDFVLCVHGRFVALELKAPGERPRKLQDYKLAQVERTGGLRLVADPDNWEEIKQTLSEMDKSKEEAWSKKNSNKSPRTR